MPILRSRHILFHVRGPPRCPLAADEFLFRLRHGRQDVPDVIASLPFTLRVPTRDALTLSQVTSTKYRFQGRLRLADRVLEIEWRGTAVVEEVGMLGVAEETLTLPHEAITLPVENIAAARLLGGWWRPRIEITSTDLTSLRIVPSEDGGRVCFWIARSDRGRAAELVASLNRL